LFVSPLSAGQQPNNEQDYANHEQYMYQRAYAWQSKETNQPKQNENYSNRHPDIHSILPA
jgi:hypothetical protein